MSQNPISRKRQLLLVSTSEEGWWTAVDIMRGGDEVGKRPALGSELSEQTCVITWETQGRDVTLFGSSGVFNSKLTEQERVGLLEDCLKSCGTGLHGVLLLAQGGQCAMEESKMVDFLLENLGDGVLKFTIVVFLEGESPVLEYDDALVDLINWCDGRYCRFAKMDPSSCERVMVLLDMVDHMVVQNGESRYTHEMLAKAGERRTEAIAMVMLKEKLQEAQGRERAAMDALEKREEERRREMEELGKKHAEEREKDETKTKKCEAKRQSCEEALKSYEVMVQKSTHSNNLTPGEATTIILLGLTGSGKTSAANTILERAGNRRPATWQSLPISRRCAVRGEWRPHAFLLVMQVGRFTQGENMILGQILKTFGRDVSEHMIVLFTQGRGPGKGNIDDYVARTHQSLQELIRRCGSRYYVLNVHDSGDLLSHSQVKELLVGVRRLVASHGGNAYMNKRFPVVEMMERGRRIMEEA
ncbi:hypothetical protein AAFF_G00135550 [Aldrovandia affinis]|uniref:AIG1-type G domain-containing protein n=1 Tax=Aldrovandia affinis TaxID=143900 RepID=A0AAD7RQ62_9TELE|nr:hypothetical protein AAFF_G00135550 [Aldrovandia affinis]